MTRVEKILFNINPATQSGIEFGPLNSPIVKREMGSIRYVDHATTDELKEKCSIWGTIDISEIVEVDYIWTNENLKLVTRKEEPFDYVIASHVIEHVPDFIGWFKEIRSVLKSGGILSLAIPDKRFTFDYLRQVTKPADVLEAYLLQSKKPSPRQIFDYKSEFVHRNKYFRWAFDEILKHEHSIIEAWEITQNAVSNNHYEDVHCWVFTEKSFLDLLTTIVNLDLFDFKVVSFFERTGHEFFISLKAMDFNINKSERLKIQLQSIVDSQKKVNKLSRSFLFDYRAWKILNLFRKK